MTSFTWLDYSEHERRQALELIDLFREDETRDELGLGTIRDCFADLFFPGTSTIQTRARYFLFTPWVYQELERKRTPSHQAADFARRIQGRLRDALIEGSEELGVIGYRAGLHVQRLPSSVYWYGLRAWGILRFEGTESDYRRYLDAFYRRREGVEQADGGESLDASPMNWDPHLPRPPLDWQTSTSFTVTREEAEYLYQRIAQRAPDSLLAHLLISRQTIADEDKFAWQVNYHLPLPMKLAEQLTHAQNFSEVMHGAALLYNLLLARQQAGGKHIPRYLDRFGQWWDRLMSRRLELHAWDRQGFWRLIEDQRARVRTVTRAFVNAWLDLAMRASSLEAITEAATAEQLIIDQEHAIKPGRARLGDHRATERWEGASGSAQLDFRWNRPVRAIVNDILEPLCSERRHA